MGNIRWGCDTRNRTFCAERQSGVVPRLLMPKRRAVMRKLITVALLTAVLIPAISLYFFSGGKERKNEMLVKDAPNVEQAANDIAPPWKRVEEALVDTVVVEQKRPHESAVLLEIAGLRETNWQVGDELTFVIPQTGYTVETQLEEIEEIAPGIISIKSYPDQSMSNHILLTVSQKNTFMSLFTPDGEYELIGGQEYGWLVSSRLLGGPTAGDAVVIEQFPEVIEAPMPKNPVKERQ